MMSVDETLMCSFQIFKPEERKQRFATGSVPQKKIADKKQNI